MNTKIEPKVIEELYSVVETFGSKYISEGEMIRSSIREALANFDEELIDALLKNEFIFKYYTRSVNGIVMFEIEKFKEILVSNQYFENSYTKYANKIGLTMSGKYIDESTEVVLDFPYKDSVLKAGMSKEDLKQDEMMLNEVIAKSEIDMMLDNKIFVNSKRYDKEGEHSNTEFDKDTDNLIIKGNNLLALHTLADKYASSVKLIYIDPPYNTGSEDSFGYNDKFTRSTWLTFMKNRLEIAKELLADDGVIFVHIDTSRASSSTISGASMEPYLHLLMEQVFETKNYLGMLHWKKKKQPSFLSRIAGVMEVVLVYAKNEAQVKKLLGGETTDSTKRVDNNSNPKQKMHIGSGIKYVGKEKNLTIKAGDYTNKTMTTTYLNDVIIEDGIVKNEFDVEAQWRTSQTEIDRFVSEKLLYITAAKSFRRFASEDEIGKSKALVDLLIDDGQNQDATNEIKLLFGNEKVFGTPKPEKLLQTIIHSASTENDIILDFFMGSATTQAVAMKMNRRFIGIEQMDYINEVSVPRLQKVIDGEQGGISKDVNWQGGGSFVYAELMSKNQCFIDEILEVKETEDLERILNKMKDSKVDINFCTDLEKIDLFDNELTLEEQKKLLIQIIDKNQLYYNYSEIDDEDVKKLLTQSDIDFNKSFYESGEEIE